MTEVLRLEKVSKVYGKGHTRVQALTNVNLSISAKEVVLIMGSSVSGKTTLLSIAGALMKPTSGRVFVDGLDITKFSERRLQRFRREHIGFIFQHFNLLPNLSAWENVMIPRLLAGGEREESEELALKLIGELGLGRRKLHKPSQLSGGEQQRVAIARSLINNPRIVLADEPTGNLDSKIGQKVVERLIRVVEDHGGSVVIVSHDEKLTDVVDRVFWLEDGKLSQRR